MKTPEEIKKGLECCMYEGECKRCPYQGEKCTITASGDALAYIQQLECERDAAAKDLETGICCETCAHYDTDAKEPPCATCRDSYAHGNWQWRGVEVE